MQDTTPGMEVVQGRSGRPIADLLQDLYVTRELTLAEVGAEIGVDAATVSRWLRKHGIQTRVIGHKKRRSAA
jgi:predicted GNAT family acetyltransferase